MSGVDKVVNFKGFLRPNKKIKYFSRTETEFKDFYLFIYLFIYLLFSHNKDCLLYTSDAADE